MIMDIDQLLTEQSVNPDVSLEEFWEDLECLMEILRECYGGYEYFGAANFVTARDTVASEIRTDFDFHRAAESVKRHFGTVARDGHFCVGSEKGESAQSDYAVRFEEWNGIPVIDCKRFWYENEAEKEELEAFVKSAAGYRNEEPLILDLRDNPGGSDVYIYDFIKGLFGVEPCYSCRFIQRYSPLFREYLKRQGIPGRYDGAVEITEDDLVPINSRKPVYVLVNEKTCSSGESAVAYLKTVSSAVIVGERTGGAFSFGNCVRVWLPNSHLPVYFGTGMVLYEKTRNIDAEGGFRGEISMEEFEKRLEL